MKRKLMPILLIVLASVVALTLGMVLFVPISLKRSAAIRSAALSGVEWLVQASTSALEISPQSLQEELTTSPSSVIVFDVRERVEYDLSHLANAIHLAPATTSLDFTRLHGNQVMGKKVIFYCSVGKRSGDAASRLESAARAKGAVEVLNLRGGIFRWHNEGFRVVNTTGLTQEIHPFNTQWKMLVKP
jgi:rhodanese-related sulfurtransferase